MLRWFDADPSRYWVIAWSSFALLSCVALIPLAAGIVSERRARRCLRFLPPWLFATTLALCFVAFRWPLWFVTREFNPDESQMIAEAITLQHDPVCWRSVDGATHGPVDTFPLLLARVVGLDLDYFGVRVVGAGMILLLIYSCYRAMAASGRECLARAAVLPILCFFAFTTCLDFVHYSSEHVPVTLLAVGFWLATAELARPEARTARSLRWALAGLVLGAVPMAKPQGAPVAATLLVSAAICDLVLSAISIRDRLRRFAVLAAAAVSVILFFAVFAWLSGSWQDAWKSYIVQNLYHAEHKHSTLPQMIRALWIRSEGFPRFATGCVVVTGMALPLALFAPAAQLRFTAFTLLFLAASFVAAMLPGWPFCHYLLFMAAPMALMAGSVWQAAYQAAAQRWPRQGWLRIVLIVLLCGAAIYPQIRMLVGKPHPYVGLLASYGHLRTDLVASEILRYAKPGEQLGIWGWACRYYVMTGMPQATRDPQTRLQIEPTPQLRYYRVRYLQDLMRSLPPVFVDAVGPTSFTFRDRSMAAHESYEYLREFIAEHYRQVADIRNCRIYVRNDRLH